MIIKPDGYLITTTVELGHFFDAEPEDVTLTLREPQNEAFFKLRAAAKEGDNVLRDALLGVLDEIVVKHTFYKSEDELMTAQDITAVINERPLLYLAIIEQYGDKVLFSRGKKSKGK